MNNLKEKLSILPKKPGCYLMKDKNDTVIYVGKAKMLKNRVKSYFMGSNDLKTQRLVNEIEDFEYIITNTNVESLILENNLIKKYEPKYNILLKDDKTYPYIKITNEKHPRLLISRGIKKDGAKYFGPYPNAKDANEVKDLLDKLYPLRKCNVMPKKVCLYYHLGQCLAPCEFHVSKEKNKEMTSEIASFLKGETREMKDELHRKMESASEKMEYERAMEYRDLILSIDKINEQQKITLNDLADRDIFGYYVDKGWMCVQVFFMRNGKLIERDVSIFPFYNEPKEDFYTFLGQFYNENIKPEEIFLPKNIEEELIKEFTGIKTYSPKQGKKRELVKLAVENAKSSLNEKFALIERNEKRTIGAVETLGEKLNIKTPIRIEAFDNSNTQGVDAVSAMIVFTDGKPNKKEYRKYKIRTVIGPDDYATMYEVIKRRYRRVKIDNLPKPDLIIVDGGKGQMSIAKKALEELGLDIPLCGVQKDEKHKTSELLFGNPVKVIDLKRDSNEFYLLQRIQDEVHRYAIDFHRQQSKKRTFKSALDDIEGIGEKRKVAILKHFKTIEKMKNAGINEYKKIGIPENVARNLIEMLNEK